MPHERPIIIHDRRAQAEPEKSVTSLPLPIVFTIITSLVTALCAYFGAQTATQSALATIKTDVAVLQDHRQSVDEHLGNLDTNVASINSDVKILLKHFGESSAKDVSLTKTQ